VNPRRNSQNEFPSAAKKKTTAPLNLLEESKTKDRKVKKEKSCKEDAKIINNQDLGIENARKCKRKKVRENGK
jgi:hypothetical protein